MERSNRPDSGSDNRRPKRFGSDAPRSNATRNDAPRSGAPRSGAPRGHSRSDAPRSDAPRGDSRGADRGGFRPSSTPRPAGARPASNRPIERSESRGSDRPRRPAPIAPPAPHVNFAEAASAAGELFAVAAQQAAPVESGSPDRLEGRNPILEALKAGRAINKLWVAKREGKPEPLLARIVSLSRDAGAVIMEVDRRVLDQMSETHGHQGVIAQVAAHEYVELDDLLAQIAEKGEKPFLVLLDELQESYNLGSILRIADAAGVHGVIIPERRSVGLDSAVAKASAGAIEHVPVCRVGNLTQTVLKLKEDGFWVAGTDSEGTIDYHKADWSGPLLIVVGSEGEGIGQQMKKHCDFLISIPMKGQVNSLNAAVAAGIVIFEAASHRA